MGPCVRRDDEREFEVNFKRGDTLSHSRDMICPRFASLFALIGMRAQGRPGARRTRGPVCKWVENTHTSIQVWLEHPGLPCAMALRLIT